MFLPLKLASFGLSLAWGFATTFVFIRIFSPEDFALLAVIAALGLTLGIADLGLSRVLISDSLNGTADGNANLPGGLLLYYFFGCAVAIIVFSAVVNPDESAIGRIQLSCYFALSALNLPWKLLQNLSLITTQYLHFELVELARRGMLILALFVLFYSQNFSFFLFLQSIAWGVSFLIAMKSLRKDLYPRKRALFSNLLSTWSYLVQSTGKIKNSVLFHANEFIIYQSLTLVTPLIYGFGAPVVQMDTFFKLHRSSTQLFRVGTESRVPVIAANLKKSDTQKLKGQVFRLFAIPITFFLAILFVLTTYGETLLNLLLDNEVAFDTHLIKITLIFIGANCLQNSAGTMQLLEGRFKVLRRISSYVLISLLLLYLFASIYSIDIMIFVGAYTLVYALGALAYFLEFLKAERLSVSN